MINRRIVKSTSMAAVVSMLVGTAIAGGITSTAYAAADNNTANDITITNPTVANQNPTASVRFHKFKAYKLADYTDPQLNKTGDAVIGYDLKQSDALKAQTLAAIKAVAITNGKVAANLTNVLNADGTFKGDAASLSPIQFVGRYFYGTGADVYGNDHANSAQVRALADYFTKNAIATLGDATEATGDINGKVDFDFGDDQIGLYLIVEDTPATGDNTGINVQTTQTVSRAMIAGTAFKVGDKYINKFIYNDDANNTTTLGEIKLKADVVTIDKETTGVNGKADSDDKLIAAGSTRSFTIKTNVPNYMNDYQDWKASGQTPYFKVFDMPSANLDAATNIKAYIDTDKDGQLSADEMKTPLTDGTDYTLTNPVTHVPGWVRLPYYGDGTDHTASNAWELSLKMTNNDGSLNESQLKKFSDAHIVITYDAKVNNTQVDNSYNVASVNYSSDPYSTDNNVSQDKENLYEADLKLEKVKFNDKATQLDGAQFKVYAGDTATGTPIKWVKEVKDTNNYYLAGANSSATDTTDTLTVNKQTILKQLAADTDAYHGATYTFVETKAPAGYILGDKPVTFSVTVKPWFDNDGELDSVSYSLNGGNYNNFLDLGTLSTANGKDYQHVYAPRHADETTRIVGGEITVENTTNIKDFAKTGGQIMSYIAAAAGLAVAGAFIAMLARRNRNKA